MDKMERQRIGARIAEKRRENRLTQKDLGAMVGMAGNQITRIERGHNSIGFDALQTIAEVFGMRVDLVNKD